MAHSSISDTERQLAEKVAAVMFENDQAAKALGISLDEIAPGFARLTMTVRKDMVNGFGIGHGGITFAFADTAFAYACNSRNLKTVAMQCTVNFVKAVQVGDHLTATAQEIQLSGKTGIYDVTVTNQDNLVVAEFRGTSYRTRETVLPPTS